MSQPRIFMNNRPQFNPEMLAKDIDIKTYIATFGYQQAQFMVWMDIVALMYEELEYYISASGTLEDILDILKPKSRRMKVDVLENGYRVGYAKRGVSAEIFEDNGALCVTFGCIVPYKHVNQCWDLSCSGSDNAAAFIAAALRAYRVTEERFKRYNWYNAA